jgi:hypothetical protein
VGGIVQYSVFAGNSKLHVSRNGPFICTVLVGNRKYCVYLAKQGKHPAFTGTGPYILYMFLDCTAGPTSRYYFLSFSCGIEAKIPGANTGDKISV